MAVKPDGRPVVVKVGGSLFNLADLGARLQSWLQARGLHPRVPGGPPVLLVPGGGPTTDVVRELDRCHGLGEEQAHWLALRALGLNAHFLAAILPAAAVVQTVEDCSRVWRGGALPILDAHAFARGDEGRPGCLPHSWEAASDAVAGRVAQVMQASALVLLKSTEPPADRSASRLVADRFVDGYFCDMVKLGLEFSAVNLRAEAWAVAQ